jgi:hypothetical protein
MALSHFGKPSIARSGDLFSVDILGRGAVRLYRQRVDWPADELRQRKLRRGQCNGGNCYDCDLGLHRGTPYFVFIRPLNDEPDHDFECFLVR